MTDYTILWLIWAAMFGVIEGVAIIKKAPGATLTSHIAKWASLKEKSGGWLARRGALAGFAGWLLYHFLSRVEW